MKLPAYATFIIRIGITFLESFVMGNTHLTAQQKTDIETAIQAGTKVLADFGAA